ncbi:MAG: YbaB/EbfC family nucleoid-associated protein [Rhodospirillaceae bacterium]|nr:YbaB/EbfC family nucleoid-associated protein [Rhodospirillaceae bacterium]|tara:strand:- start:332 stop:652 length:321 start_codon:yes stop_codon:yes gene_type:complete
MNLAKMMKQAQELQGKMAQVQEDLAAAEIEGSSGAGMVKAVMTGKHELRSLSIDPSLVTRDDTEVLEDLIVAAVNDARTRVEVHVKEKMSEVTGGLNLPPGLNLPF